MNIPRHTLQREVVLQEICQIHSHATADMIYDKIHKSHPLISKATVYRNLRVLEKQGKVMKIKVPGGADYFEASKQEHYHIKCVRCGKVFDSSLPHMPNLLKMAQEADRDFEFFACNLLFEGFCPNCKKEQETKK